jgi:hypothetical protein
MGAKQVILQPASGKAAQLHLDASVRQPLPLSRFEAHLHPNELSELVKACGSDNVRVWGVTPGGRGQNATKWKRIHAGDIVLFTGDNRAFGKATICYKCRNRSLALSLWGAIEGRTTWEYVYFMEGYSRCDVPYETINAAAGYAATYVPLGFTVLDLVRSAAVRDAVRL